MEGLPSAARQLIFEGIFTARCRAARYLAYNFNDLPNNIAAVAAGIVAGPAAAEDVVTVYSADGLHDGTPSWYGNVFEAFTKATGIKVQ